ncbi:3-oxoacyl-[acyl-carrier-protein] reductase [Desulfohalobium retbaense]|uniref:3-oxoacyl-[acyl-carrier-protein] reductase n=1 Tax=Desulfohalobium retbaense (strain ATCC 49708 / DSM 5692 / JCM 16813 / HR100) TaxID=485915 RepID=C8X2Q5_DESRD|nr:3-oxoacyl-[acyl-carrier-protein] reductase [Desulfohalobium retbaense]ACV68702.1 3-oxoacyl-(acyl-carrier-protein) reductase [Desulfohalobium retbaense DSM 5692]
MDAPRPAALVTGGSRGIGKAVATRLAKDGFEVLLTYVSKPDEAQAVCDDIASQGGTARALSLNIGDTEAVAAFFRDHIAGKVDLQVLVNNAGITKDGLLVRMKPADWEQVIQVNLTGSFACLQQAAKIMMKRRSGRIINIASVVAQTGNPGQANYVAAKSGLIGLTKTAALELAPRGVTVNAVAPGFIATDMTDALSDSLKEQYQQKIPLQQFGRPEDIAGTVSFLASDEAGYITGQVLGVNGGMHLN